MNEEPVAQPSGEPVSGGATSQKHELNLQPSEAFAAEQQGSAPGIASSTAQPNIAATQPVASPSVSPPSVSPAAPMTYTAPNRTDVQNIYPEPASVQQSQQLHTGFSSSASVAALNNAQASSAFAEALTLILGIGSSVSYILIIYFVKNLWATAVVCALLAIAAIFFAMKDYRTSNKITPLTVVGISAATFTLITIGIAVSSYLVARASLGSYY